MGERHAAGMNNGGTSLVGATLLCEAVLEY